VITQFYNYLSKKHNIIEPIVEYIPNEVNKLDNEETKKVMENLVDKIARRIDNSNQAHLENLSKTNLFTKLMNKYETLDLVK
jgi:hypothetical protein